MVEPYSAKIGSNVTANAAPISQSQAGVSSEHMKHPTTSTDAESFFIEPASPRQEARKMASDVICRLLIWMADGRTLEDRGLRACVALYCIRPDLIDCMTLDGIGALAGRREGQPTYLFRLHDCPAKERVGRRPFSG